MEVERFKQLVSRLEQQSASAPAVYRAKVAALTLLGFGILALTLGAVGIVLLLLVGIAVSIAIYGGAAVLLLLKFGKLLVFLAIPLWFLVKAASRALFVRVPAPEGREITRGEAPALFQALDTMRRQLKGPRFHKVLLIDAVNAAVVQRPAFGLVGWPRNYLLLGLPLLESMPAPEALAVVAHEYGHLAGSHGHFSAFVYRLRHSWGTVQAYTDHVQGWLGRLVSPLVRWYAPYFNAYTFVLARADEYQADAASADLVGACDAARALKRINLVGPRHERFMQQTFERIDHDAQPPSDLMHRWAAQAVESPAEADAQRWLADALDREGHFTDTHPTLRARLAALPPSGEPPHLPPPALQGESAARAWLGAQVDMLRAEFEARWAHDVAEPWAQRHAEAQHQRWQLAQLRALAEPDTEQQVEQLQLTRRLEPETDLRDALAAFNAAHADHPLGLYLEGLERLRRDDREGLRMLERAMTIDPEATLPACKQAYAFLLEHKDGDAAEAYAVRWRERDAMESLRRQQIETIDPAHALAPHGLDADTVAALKRTLSEAPLRFVDRVYLARRVIPADPTVVQLCLGVQLSWWGRRRGRQLDVLNRLAVLQWPVAMDFLTLDGPFAPMKRKMLALPTARLH